MSKKAKDGLTPENFLESYRPLAPGRGNPQGDNEAKTELAPVETNSAEAEAGKALPLLSSRKAGKKMTADEYLDTFITPNWGKPMRSKKVIYLNPKLKKDFDKFFDSLGEEFEGMSMSLFVHNLIIHHISVYRDAIRELAKRNNSPESFLDLE